MDDYYTEAYSDPQFLSKTAVLIKPGVQRKNGSARFQTHHWIVNGKLAGDIRAAFNAPEHLTVFLTQDSELTPDKHGATPEKHWVIVDCGSHNLYISSTSEESALRELLDWLYNPAIAPGTTFIRATNKVTKERIPGLYNTSSPLLLFLEVQRHNIANNHRMKNWEFDLLNHEGRRIGKYHWKSAPANLTLGDLFR